MPNEIMVFINSFFFYLGIRTFIEVNPRYNRPEILRNELFFFFVSTLMLFSYVGFVIWSFFRITWYINILILFGSFIVSALLFKMIPAVFAHSALGLIVPAIVIPLLYYIVAW